MTWSDVEQYLGRSRDVLIPREGHHATPSEVALTQAIHPDSARAIEGPLDIDSCRPRGIRDSASFRAWYPDGRMGSDPSMATIDHGKRILAAAVDGLVEHIGTVFTAAQE